MDVPTQPNQKTQQLMKVVGRNIRSARRGQGLTIQAVAAAAQIAPSQINEIEAALRVSEIDTLSRLCSALGIQLMDCANPNLRLGPSVSDEPVCAGMV